MKKIISKLLAAGFVTAMFVMNVSAADYGVPPYYPPPSTPPPTISGNDVSNAVADTSAPAVNTPSGNTGGGEISGNTGGNTGGGTPSVTQPAADPAGQVSAGSVIQALVTGVPIEIPVNESVLLTVDAISEIAKHNTPVSFVTNQFTITIDPSDITNNAKPVNLNLNISLNSNKQLGGETVNSIVIAPPTSGDYGFAMTITIPAAAIASSGFDTSNLKAYHISSSGVITEYPLTSNADGSVSLKISGASEYIITDKVIAAATTGAGTIAPAESGASGNPQTGIAENPLFALLIGIPSLGIAVFAGIKIKKHSSK